MSTHQDTSRGKKRDRPSSSGGGGGCRPRIILLLDLDCFYAQCESVRLGLEKSLPLCLLQWDSALAVNYAARSFGIKRGDGFDEINKKSQGQCVALHLPVISVEDITASTAASNSASGEDGGQQHGDTATEDGSRSSELEQSYDAIFNLPAEMRAEMFKKEKNVMRHPHEGKASLERYRLASARIFSVITEALTANVGKGNFVLERASIDEIFLDVSEHCYRTAEPAWKDATESLADATRKETVVFGANTKQMTGEHDNNDDDDEESAALHRGCIVARNVRKAVFDALGFTMSAGISINKTVAKLGASYGKPDGQAVVYPELIPRLMDETPIRKCRNMGGKIGKQVLSLLPEDEDTMGSVARLLSLYELIQRLGRGTAQRVFNAARGIDGEPVLETKGALTKSITAFKSFGATYLEDLDKWTRLLATDVVARVEQDSKRNERHPKSCNIQYIFSSGLGGSHGGRTTRSARIPFPKGSNRQQRLEQLISKVTDTLAKRDDFPIHRLGLSAIDFELQSRNGAIDAFFAKQVSPQSQKTSGGDEKSELQKQQKEQKTDLEKAAIDESSEQATNDSKAGSCSKMDSIDDASKSSCNADLAYARNLQATLNESASASASFVGVQQQQQQQQQAEDPDLEYAQRLQASFDTEERMLSALDTRRSSSTISSHDTEAKKRQKLLSSSGFRNGGSGGGGAATSTKIDNFFSVKKK